MSEVKRYDIAEYGGGMDVIVDGGWVVALDFDRATAERDAALSREASLEMSIQELSGANAELIQKCNALDQSETALREELANASATIELKQRDLIEAQTAVSDWARKCKAAEQRNAALMAFANELTSAAFEGGSFDGGDIQDIAVKHGLMCIETRTEECCEGCQCREYGFPAECYRKTDLIKPTESGASE